jgi:glycosyltransferase involved in cell wall biosynthesis
VPSLGVRDSQAIHLPCGLRHKKYRLLSPLENRPPQVAMAYNAHVVKAGGPGLEALASVKDRMPGTNMVVFGTHEPEHDVPAGFTYMTSPPQVTIVEEIYNGSRIFLNSSNREGFGMPSIEAMACGCALVTTDNGGSRDFAAHGKTALVAAPGDISGLATHVEALLSNDSKRIRLARAGIQFVRQRFDWDRSGRRLELFLHAYRVNPDRYQKAAPGWRGAEARSLDGKSRRD